MRWIALIAAAWVALSAGHCVGQPHSQPIGTSAETTEGSPPAPPQPVMAGPEQYAAPCEGAKNGEDTTDCYARRSAEADEKQAYEAVVANRLGWIQALGLAATVGLTLFGLNLARRALNEVERAFVFVETGEAMRIGDAVAIHIRWKNSGSTPAVRMVTRANMRSFDKPLVASYDFPEADEPGPDIGKFASYASLFLGPGASTQSGALLVPSAYLQDIFDEKAFVYVWAWAEYDDVLKGPRHRTEYCSRLRIVSLEKVEVEGAGPHYAGSFAFDTHWQHNGVDEQCMKKTDRWPGNPA